MIALSRRLAGEAIGSAALAAIVIGSGVMAERLAGGSVALALLGNTLATAAGLYALIVVFAPVSGAQFNPMVTFALVLRRELRPRAAVAYVFVQLVGMLIGVGLAHAMFELPLAQLSIKPRPGWSQAFGEGAATFMLLLAVFGTRRRSVECVAATVALTIAAGYWFTSSTSFANPAITLARALSDTFAGIRPGDVPGFVAGQLVGGLLATALAPWLFALDAGAARITDQRGR